MDNIEIKRILQIISSTLNSYADQLGFAKESDGQLKIELPHGGLIVLDPVLLISETIQLEDL
jgi:hypothetical protein